MRVLGSDGKLAQAAVIWLALALTVSLAGRALADGKKLEVIAEHSTVRLEPDAHSPAVEVLPKGSVLSLASDVRMRKTWLYVSFPSFKNGTMRSGYVPEAEVRKLYPALKVSQISSEEEILNPKAIDLNAPLHISLEWGTTKESIMRTEGKPHNQTASQGVEVLEYRREIMNKKCLVEYVLSRNRLVTTRFHLIEQYADKDRYIEDYDKIRGFLTAKVGTPRSDKALWPAGPPPHPVARMGEALSKGEVEFSSEWVFADTSVHLVLTGGNNRVSFGAEIVDVKAKNPVSF